MHADTIVLLNQEAKFSMQEPTNIDNEVSDEIPSDTLPHLQKLVLKHMIHHPCTVNLTARCLRKEDSPRGSQNRFDQRQHPLRVIIT